MPRKAAAGLWVQHGPAWGLLTVRALEMPSLYATPGHKERFPREVFLLPRCLDRGAITLKTKPTFRDQRPGIRVLLDHCHLKEKGTLRGRGAAASGTISDQRCCSWGCNILAGALAQQGGRGEHRTELRFKGISPGSQDKGPCGLETLWVFCMFFYNPKWFLWCWEKGQRKTWP